MIVRGYLFNCLHYHLNFDTVEGLNVNWFDRIWGNLILLIKTIV